MIRKLNENDVESIYNVECSCFSHAWEKQVLLGTLRQNSYHFFGCFENDKILGYGSVTIVADESYVNRIAVVPEFRKKGIGKLLLASLISTAKENNASFISLEVRKSNTVAIKLYSDSGFEIVGERKNFYDNPKEDALIMTNTLM